MPTDLADVLGAEPPASISDLPAEVLTRLTGQIDDARRRQADTMAASVKTALKGVPVPFRGVVRKALLG